MSLEKIFDQSPTIQYIKADTERKARSYILRRLSKRFGEVPEDLSAHLRTIEDSQKLDDLLDAAYDCADLEAFRVAIGGKG